MAASAGALWAVNGTVAKVIREHGLSSLRLAEIRSAGAFVGLGLAVLAIRPGTLRFERRELAFLAAFGIAGLAWVQWAYFLAIKRLDIGVALLIQYTAPLLVALYAALVLHEHVRRRIWVALLLSLAGLSLVVDAWHGVSLDGIGVAASVAGALAYALYLVQADHALGRRDPLSLLCLGFGFATLFFSVVAPWWTFPWGLVSDTVSLLGNLASVHAPVWALLTWVIVLGTIVPFVLLVGALRHLPATRVAIIAMLELVLATLVAWAWLGESLTVAQLGGAAIVLTAIVLAQTARS
jgi:drug/metabolite transporter (DMT)-like permease